MSWKRTSMLYFERDGVPVPADHRTTEGMAAWNAWCTCGGNRIVARTMIGSVLVSTVFLGVDHSFGSGPPLLYETMVFGSEEFANEQERYTTRAEALAGHAEMVRRVERARQRP